MFCHNLACNIEQHLSVFQSVFYRFRTSAKTLFWGDKETDMWLLIVRVTVESYKFSFEGKTRSEFSFSQPPTNKPQHKTDLCRISKVKQWRIGSQHNRTRNVIKVASTQDSGFLPNYDFLYLLMCKRISKYIFVANSATVFLRVNNNAFKWKWSYSINK